MTKKRNRRRPSTAKHFGGLASLLISIVTSAGLGGWAFPDTPVLGRAVRAFLPSVRSRTHGESSELLTHAREYAEAHRPASNGNGYLPNGSSRQASASPGGRVRARPASYAAPINSNEIRIASYNIQVFGSSKLAKQNVMTYLADIVRRFDLVAIQEVRSKDNELIPKFVRMFNANGRRYKYVIGPRLGRTNSKEQYAFIFDSDRIEHDPRSVITIDDPHDTLHRPPLVTRFRVRTASAADGFTFWLVNSHTDPDEVKSEVDALAKVFESVQARGWGEDDVILLGDLNASERQLGRLGALPGMHPIIQGITTNTRGNKTYDNLLLDLRATTEFTGQSGVLDVMREYGLTMDQALQLSDHLPVWGVFQAYESQATASQQPAPDQRSYRGNNGPPATSSPSHTAPRSRQRFLRPPNVFRNR